MSSISKKNNKINAIYNLYRVFIFIFIGVFSLSVQAMEEAVYLQIIDKKALSKQKNTAPLLLTRKHDNPEPVQFISEKTNFKWNNQNIKFPIEYSLFLNKTEELKLKQGSYNHLCLTLYAIYKDGENSPLKIVESPLFAQENQDKFSLNEDDCLERKVTVEFYTKLPANDNDRWAYFTTYDGRSLKVRKDKSILSINSPDKCEKVDCNAVCKKYYPHNKGTCQHSKNACGHTEPNALFHINKNSINLFKPLIEKTKDVKNIQSIGIRFFSYYEPCSECVNMLHKNRSIKYATNKSLKSSFIFYFNRTYQTPVMKINNNQLQLFNSSNYYFFRGFIKNNKIYNFEDDEEDDSLGESLGYIKLEENINLAKKDYIFLIRYLKDFDFTESNKLKIYIY